MISNLYRSGLKTALGARQNVNNEIIYIETNTYPLMCNIKKRQLKFWKYINEYTEKYPESAIKKMLHLGTQANVKYLKHYETLARNYITPERCQILLQNDYITSWKNKFAAAVNTDPDSKLSPYYRINPNLNSYVLKPQLILEAERIVVTRFRTGSHSLGIEIGRYGNTPRDHRLCKCKLAVQTVWHIFSDCPITMPHVNTKYPDIQAVFNDEHIYQKLLLITKKLKIPIGSEC